MSLLSWYHIHRALQKSKKYLAEEEFWINEVEKINQEIEKVITLITSTHNTLSSQQHTTLNQILEKKAERCQIELKKLQEDIHKSPSLGVILSKERVFLSPKINNLCEENNVTLRDLRVKTLSSNSNLVSRDIEQLLRKLIYHFQKLPHVLRKYHTLLEIKEWLNQEHAYWREITDLLSLYMASFASTLSESTLTRRKFLKLVSLGAASALNISTNPTSYMGLYLTLKTKEYALPLPTTNALAILIGNLGVLSIPPDNLNLFKDIYVMRVELAFDTRALRIYKNATTTDFFNVLADPAIQHIAVFGHGEDDNIKMCDNPLTSLMISNYYYTARNNNISLPKTGYLLKHGCGEGANSLKKWGEPAFLHNHILEWRRLTSIFEVLVNPLAQEDHWFTPIGETLAEKVGYIRKNKRN